ncbi:MAG: hypothetical protein ACP5IL_07840 [Syntrophobacteraceae bacterium]
MSFDPHFVAALAGLLLSEVIPIVTKSRYGGIIHAAVLLIGKLYSSPNDISGLSAQIVSLQAQVEMMRQSVTVAQAPPTPTPTIAPQG